MSSCYFYKPNILIQVPHWKWKLFGPFPVSLCWTHTVLDTHSRTHTHTEDWQTQWQTASWRILHLFIFFCQIYSIWVCAKWVSNLCTESSMAWILTKSDKIRATEIKATSIRATEITMSSMELFFTQWEYCTQFLWWTHTGWSFHSDHQVQAGSALLLDPLQVGGLSANL